ncbi:hypothetical protein BFS06_11795 [Clostridium perfringens]|uniref:Uncharacterized protein n=1 Tax=Clostridium perfringens TaxID=1502 RepID=A0A140GS70_CLOPF|nr:hypothetical protein [Clostridium perfringens]AMN31379.1 hypothetical protein JFP838_pA0463 [Clostridium perfringens]TBX14895.1 hypothetical protein BFS06_11795 [Clostridium perfringens]
MDIDNYSNKIKMSIDILSEKIKDVDETPIMILTDLFKGPINLDLLILMNNYFGLDLLNLQSDLYKKVFPELRNLFKEDNIYFNFDENEFGSYIEVLYNSEPLFNIDIYNKLYIIIKNQDCEELAIKENETRAELDQLLKIQQENQIRYDNPLIDGGANIFKLINIACNKKKYKDNILKDLDENNKSIYDLKNKIAEIKCTNEYIRDKNFDFFSKQENICRILDGLGYTQKEL